MVQNKAEIASKSIYNPRASRALERALDPDRKGLRASALVMCASRTYSAPSNNSSGPFRLHWSLIRPF